MCISYSICQWLPCKKRVRLLAIAFILGIYDLIYPLLAECTMPVNTTTIVEPDIAILRALNRFNYLTTAHTSPLLTRISKTITAMQRGVLSGWWMLGLFFGLARCRCLGMGGRRMSSLGACGRQYRAERGEVASLPYYRPSEEEEKPGIGCSCGTRLRWFTSWSRWRG
jgi:hypothetical protein